MSKDVTCFITHYFLQIHNALRNVFNLSMVKLCLEHRGNCGQVSPSLEENPTKEMEQASNAFEKTTTERKVSSQSSTVTFENIEDDEDDVKLFIKSK